MSEQESGGIFCCCRRSQTRSPAKYAHNVEPELKLKGERRSDGGNTVIVPSTEASKSKDEMEMWMSGSFTSDDKSLDASQHIDADTLVLPSRLKSFSQAENETETAGSDAVVPEIPTVDIHLSSVDLLLSSDDNMPSSEYLVNLEEMIERLETVADQLESESCAAQDIATMAHENNADAISVCDRDSSSTTLTNGQWNVANHNGKKRLLLKITEDLQCVNIHDCSECTIEIEGKPDSIAINNCVNCGVVLQDASSALTVTDCRRIQIQVLGAVPSINARNTDGLSVYLSEQCQDLPVYGFKCSELNLLIPLDDGDFKEISIPEQFQSRWNGERWITTNFSDIMI